MNHIFNRPTFFIKEHTGIFKAANNYDIFDADSAELLLECREEELGFFTKLLRFTGAKTMTPFCSVVRTADGTHVMTIRRGVSFIFSKVEILDDYDNCIGILDQRFGIIRGKFDMLDADGNLLCEVRGNWTSWGFKFLRGEEELAAIHKQWAGFAKELFTTADNYVLEIYPSTPENVSIRAMMLATVLCVDFVFKEQSN
jgi:uncharacterized protein YxjI